MGMVIALVTQDPIILKIQMGWSKISLRYTMSRGWEIKQIFFWQSSSFWGLSYCFNTERYASPKELLNIFCLSSVKLLVHITINDLRLVPGKIGFLTWGRRGRRRVNPEEVILEESPQVPLPRSIFGRFSSCLYVFHIWVFLVTAVSYCSNRRRRMLMRSLTSVQQEGRKTRVNSSCQGDMEKT